MVTRTSLVVLLGAFAWANASVFAAADSAVPSISTVGVAEQEYAPDRAHMFVRLKSVRDTFALARDDVNAALARLRVEATRVGLSDGDVAISIRSLRKEYAWDGRTQVYRGQACEQQVEVVVRDLALLESVTEALVMIDHLELNSMDFRSSKEGEAKRSALLLAAQAARDKAEALATVAEVRIAGVIEIVEEASASPGDRSISNNLRQVNNEVSFEGGGQIANERVRVQVRARYALE